MAEQDFRVVVLGAGMAGILAGIRLRQAGIENFTIYEKADQIGGTWRDNTYPGLTCDVSGTGSECGRSNAEDRSPFQPIEMHERCYIDARTNRLVGSKITTSASIMPHEKEPG